MRKIQKMQQDRVYVPRSIYNEEILKKLKLIEK
jgi:hypothetical protein